VFFRSGTPGWVFAIFFSLFIISMIMLSNWLPALVLFIVVFLCLPPMSSHVKKPYGRRVHPVLALTLHLTIIAALLMGAEIPEEINSIIFRFIQE